MGEKVSQVDEYRSVVKRSVVHGQADTTWSSFIKNNTDAYI